MDAKKRQTLEAAGWRFGDYGDFLGLDDAERRLVELRAETAAAVRRLREGRGLSQPQAAKLIGSSQPRFVSIEKGVGVSLDLLLKSYLALGGSLGDLVERVEPRKQGRRAKTAAASAMKHKPASSRK